VSCVVAAVIAAYFVGAHNDRVAAHVAMADSVHSAFPPTAPPLVPPPLTTHPRRITIAAVGDIMMGSPQFGLPPNNGAALFSSVRRDLAAQVVVGNLEGTLTLGGPAKCGSVLVVTCYAFRSPPRYARNLRRAGFTVMNQANNHANDFGAVGQGSTRTALRGVGIAETGLAGQFATVRVNGIRVAILGFAPYTWANRSDLLADVRAMVRRAAARADVVVVNVHAGAEGRGAQHVHPGTEYYLGENRGDVVAFSQTAIDAGADLVVGSGPHVLRGMAFYHHRLIAFSMGNFVGYRGFGLGGVLSESGILRVTLTSDGAFDAGRFISVGLDGLGVPSPGGSSRATVATLSRQDFGARAARVLADGSILPPRTP